MFNEIRTLIDESFTTDVVDEIRKNIPTSLDQKDAEVIIANIKSAVACKVSQVTAAVENAEEEVNNQIESISNTTNDLKQLPRLGKIGLFLRGIQRPVWGFAVLYIDLMVFSGSGGWKIEDDSPLSATFLALNILVLGFLFGERAIKNLLPLFSKYMKP
ncbi:MAG: hypothetical protein JW786_03885 [Desulfobacterales bacterium]|nr:hypothetical protein [Desulfobacterales bacterium]